MTVVGDSGLCCCVPCLRVTNIESYEVPCFGDFPSKPWLGRIALRVLPAAMKYTKLLPFDSIEHFFRLLNPLSSQWGTADAEVKAPMDKNSNNNKKTKQNYSQQRLSHLSSVYVKM